MGNDASGQLLAQASGVTSAIELEGEAAARQTLNALYRTAVAAVSSKAAMPAELPFSKTGKLAIIAVGKAAADMMAVAKARATRPFVGLVVTRYGHAPDHLDLQGIEVLEAGHPVPDACSIEAARRALDIAKALEAGDQLLVLLSGGGSALLASPVEGVTLEDKQDLTKRLLQSGATIAEINCVRKHLSTIKGGRLAAAAGAAHVSTWIISDIPGDDPSFVSSGPTVADDTSLEMARDVIDRYKIKIRPSILAALTNSANETPRADTLGLAGAETILIARARDALAAAASQANNEGYRVTNLGDQLQAEARHLGASHAALARRLASDGAPRVIVSGGETTVTVINPKGRGGRNLEYLLGLAIALDGAPCISALAADTDGIDGTEDVAGAIVTPTTLTRAKALGLDPGHFLNSNDAYRFFEALGDLLITGPTLTNVNDFRAILIEGDGSQPRIDTRTTVS